MSGNSTIGLNFLSLQINRYFSTPLFLFGILGNLFSCLVFFQRTLRSNPCVIYLFIASISNLISIISGLPSRLLNNWDILPDFTETSASLCQIRLFVLLTSRTIASWLVLSATIDRYLVSSTNIHRRQMSNLKHAYRCTIVVCLISLLVWSETFYCFDANLLGTPTKCYAKSDACRILNDLAQAFLTTLIPALVMIIFGLYTIKNIRALQRIRPIVFNPQRRKKLDRSLTKLLFVQVLLLTIFSLPQATQKFYLTYTFYQQKSPEQKLIENLLFNLAISLNYIPNCIPFYLFILSSSTFRKTLVQIFRNVFPSCFQCL